jgi:hypothetical protein
MSDQKLPEPNVLCDCGGNYYTAEQVREAMEQAKAQERERLFHLIRDDKTLDPIIDDLTKLRECTPGGHCHHVSGYALAEALADAIRNG